MPAILNVISWDLYARRLQAHSDILFVLCGEGAAREMLEIASEGLPNVRFLSLQPLKKLNQLLNVADIHGLPQKAGAADLVMPSKLTGMMASEKAIITTADPDAEVGSLVSQIGVIVPPDDSLALSNAILTLVKSPEKRFLLGEKSRTYVCYHWSANRVLAHFQKRLQRLADLSV